MKFAFSPRKNLSAMHRRYAGLPRKARYPIASLMLIGLFGLSVVGGAAGTYLLQNRGQQTAAATGVLGAKTKATEPTLSSGSAIITRDNSITEQVAADAAAADSTPSPTPTPAVVTKPVATTTPITAKPTVTTTTPATTDVTKTTEPAPATTTTTTTPPATPVDPSATPTPSPAT